MAGEEREKEDSEELAVCLSGIKLLAQSKQHGIDKAKLELGSLGIKLLAWFAQHQVVGATTKIADRQWTQSFLMAGVKP
jgi:hypothetical protein